MSDMMEKLEEHIIMSNFGEGEVINFVPDCLD